MITELKKTEQIPQENGEDMKRKSNMWKKGKRGILLALLVAMFTLLAGCGKEEDTAIRVGSLKGPTSIGLLELMEQNEQGQSANTYEFTMETTADTLLAAMVQGELDIALVPANVASVLYQKTEGGVCVVDINTLGVLYMVSGDTSITTMADLEGKTIYLTGKGTTPDYVLQYLISASGMEEANITIEYKSEATEIAAVLSENPDAVGLLPQPFATVAMQQNDALEIVLDTTAEWNRIQETTGEGSALVTGVTIVRKAFLEENEEAVLSFLAEHASSAAFTASDVETTAAYVAEAGIIENPQIAALAIPYCNIVCISGEEMKTALDGYLNVLYAQEPASVGGNLPGEDFYYIPAGE